MRFLCVVVLGLLASGCGGNSPEQACEDVADTIASAAQMCGFDYQTNYDAFVLLSAGGSCANVKSVRDEGALYDDCLPAMKALSCAQLNDPGLMLPDSCKAQLSR